MGKAKKGMIFQKTIGYWKPFIKPGIFDENKEVEKNDRTIKDYVLTYNGRCENFGASVIKWSQEDKEFKLSPCDPTSRWYLTGTGFAKCSLKRHEALVMCYGDFKTFPKDCIDIDINLFEELMGKTHKLLLEKCNDLIQTATQKKFKKGWVFYRMKEDYLAIDRLWEPHGFYYRISNDVAGSYSCKYNSKHPDDIEKAERVWRDCW